VNPRALEMDNNKELQTIINELPEALRSLLEAELAAGNEIAEVGHSYPAPPIGAYIKLAKPVSTRSDDAKDELTFREHNSSLYSGEYTDSNRRFFILTPPKPAFKTTRRTSSPKLPKTNSEKPNRITDSDQSRSVSPLQRFEKSMEMNYEKWHDGIGYDIDAIKLASPTERKAIEQMLLHHSPRDWRDIEALAEIGTKSAQKTIKNAIKDSDPDVRVAVTRFAPNLVTNRERSQSLIKALKNAQVFGGLSQVLDDIEEYHPTEVKEALITGLLSREGDVAVLFAAMLFYVYGKAKEPFDMKQRPFFLRFNTENREERMQAFRELCKQLNINPEKYLAPK
jgi:hypothetical protein